MPLIPKVTFLVSGSFRSSGRISADGNNAAVWNGYFGGGGGSGGWKNLLSCLIYLQDPFGSLPVYFLALARSLQMEEIKVQLILRVVEGVVEGLLFTCIPLLINVIH